MSLLGHGAIAIWHDIAREGRSDFYAWHGREHMRERISIPGFLRGRRYVCVAGSPEYFNLYETESFATTTDKAYLERLNHPTSWTMATVPHFQNVARSLCSVVASFGRGQGGLIATFRYSVSEVKAAEHKTRMSGMTLPKLADQDGVAGCHLLTADKGASARRTAEAAVRREDNQIPAWIVLVEGWGDQSAFETFCRAFLADDGIELATHPPLFAMYRLQSAVDRGDL